MASLRGMNLGFSCLLAVLFVCREAGGAAIIEDQTSTWEMAGLGDYFARAIEDILPPSLLERVVDEVLLFEKSEREARAKEVEGGHYMHGKGGTFWRPLFNSQGEFLKPRFAIEAAIQLIYQTDIGKYKHDRVSGGEWWVQRRDEREDIGFHHDKDESLASNKMTMKFPEVSTVTYLSPIGGPTLIFNQTTLDGNSETPAVPSRGFLSYPYHNRHMIFRGNLQHGVPGHLALPLTGSSVNLRGGKRITLLINWWNDKPLGPNCNKVDTKRAKSLGVYDKEGMAALMASPEVQGHRPTAVATERLHVPTARAERERHAVKLAGFDIVWFDLPKSGLTPNAWTIEWGYDQSFGYVCHLDLRSGVVGALFREPKPKVLVFVPQGGAFEAASEFVLPIAKHHVDTLKFVFADPATTENAMAAFGLTAQDAPIAVIHRTHPSDQKYLPPPGARALTEAGLKRMVGDFLAGKLRGMAGNDAEDGEL